MLGQRDEVVVAALGAARAERTVVARELGTEVASEDYRGGVLLRVQHRRHCRAPGAARHADRRPGAAFWLDPEGTKHPVGDVSSGPGFHPRVRASAVDAFRVK